MAFKELVDEELENLNEGVIAAFVKAGIKPSGKIAKKAGDDNTQPEIQKNKAKRKAQPRKVDYSKIIKSAEKEYRLKIAKARTPKQEAKYKKELQEKVKRWKSLSKK